MTRPPSALRNIGPAMDAAFARAGIHSAEELVALGADAAYARLLATGARPHFAMFWALAFAIQDRPWTTLGPEEKAAMRVRFDAIKARATLPEGSARARLEAGLDRLGVGLGSAQPTISRPEKK